jgi:hypothetical protein
MKKILYFVVFATLLSTFTSCNKDEDIYQPKQKLYKIWELSEVGPPDQTFFYDKKNLLTEIDDHDQLDSVHYFFKFTYNKDKTVSTIEHSTVNYTENVSLYYMNKLVNRMTYTMDGSPRLEIVFTRDGETSKITRIVEYYDAAYFASFEDVNKAALYKRFFGANEVIENYYKKNGAKSFTLRCDRNVVYTGNNITHVTEVYPEYSTKVTYDYTYDTLSFNPYYGLPYTYKGLLGFSENNRASSYVTNFLNNLVQTEVYTTFQYFLDENSFPRRMISRKSPENIPFNTYFLYQLK